jgi:hypothetical protein
MHVEVQRRSLRYGSVCAAILLAVTVVQTAQSQNYAVIHTFTGGPDGARPATGLTIDKAGNLYGTTSAGSFGKVYHSTNGLWNGFRVNTEWL